MEGVETDLVSRDQRSRERPIWQHGLACVPVGCNVSVDDGQCNYRSHSDTQMRHVNEGKCEDKRAFHIGE